MPYDKILPFLVYMLTLRNSGGLEHSDSVTFLAVKTARRLGLPEAFLQQLEFAARVHDIGKLAISDEILNKPGRFTRFERVAMQQHPLFGVEMLRLLDSLPEGVLEMVRDHHENFDGSGYPNRLKGEQISMGGQIIALADRFHAMTTTYRVYRPVFSSAAALQILQDEGVKYDPKILKVFAEVVNDSSH